jgi:hypothetical protein
MSGVIWPKLITKMKNCIRQAKTPHRPGAVSFWTHVWKKGGVGTPSTALQMGLLDVLMGAFLVMATFMLKSSNFFQECLKRITALRSQAEAHSTG